MEREEGRTRGVSERERREEKKKEGTEVEEKKSHSQLAEFLAELPGIGPNPADGVVSQVELLQRQQAVEPALTHLR